MDASKKLPFILSVFLGGVFIASVIEVSIVSAVALVFISLLYALMQFSLRSKRMLGVSFLFLALSAGILRFVFWDTYSITQVETVNSETKVTLVGVISDEPDVRESKTHLILRILGQKKHAEILESHGNILLVVNRFPEYHYGDQLEVTGILKAPDMFHNNDGRIFNYPDYLKSKGITLQMFYPDVVLTGEKKGNIFMHGLLAVKQEFITAINYALPSPHNALLTGLLLGGKQTLGDEWIERFRIAGIVHIVVLSGYNMTIVSEWLVVIFRFLGFFGSLTVGGVGIALFAVMAGGGATVVRAAIMAFLVLIARATGRTYDIARALLLAGVIMVIINPSILLSDPSFQLSFLASMGLILVAPVLHQRIKLFTKNFVVIREVIISTIATQIAVLPLLLYQTGLLSLVSLPANLLILPLVPFTMFFGFLGGVVATIHGGAGIIAMIPAQVLLSWILSVAEYATVIPYASISIPVMSSFSVFVLYGLIAFWLAFEHRKNLSQNALVLQEPPVNLKVDKKQT